MTRYALAAAILLTGCATSTEADRDRAWAECERRWQGAARADCIAKLIQEEQLERTKVGQAGEDDTQD